MALIIIIMQTVSLLPKWPDRNMFTPFGLAGDTQGGETERFIEFYSFFNNISVTQSSENPKLPDLLDRSGIMFLGPSGGAMRALGDKIRPVFVESRFSFL